MEENTQKVDIGYIANRVDTEYQDENVVIYDRMPKLPDNKVYKIEMLMCYGFVKGRIQFDLNGKTFEASQNDIALCLPNSYIENYMMSPDLEVRIIGISYDVLQRHLNISKNYWNIIKYISMHPVMRLDDAQWKLLTLYGNLFRFKKDSPMSYYHKETVQSLLRCLFLELASIITPKLNNTSEDGVLRHGEQIFKRFLELLSTSEGRNRSVKDYAEKLCITPKYLSTLSKSASGRPALSWIHQFTAEAIERRLKYSDKSIKEISDEMNFPNLSFFGKFTKSHLGKSPSEFRRKMNNL